MEVKGKMKWEEEEEDEVDDDLPSDDPHFDILKQLALWLNKKDRLLFKKAFDLKTEIYERRSKRIKRKVLRMILWMFKNFMPKFIVDKEKLIQRQMKFYLDKMEAVGSNLEGQLVKEVASKMEEKTRKVLLTKLTNSKVKL